MIDKRFKMEQAPFNKQTNMKAPRGSENLQTQVSTEMFNMFMTFAKNYDEEHNIEATKKGNVNKAAPLKHILNEFLNNNAIEKRCYDNLFVIMVFNRIEFKTPFKTDVDGAVIGFVDYSETFCGLFGNYDCFTHLQDFNRKNFDLLNLDTLDCDVLFDIPRTDIDDFEKVKRQLQDLHKDIDFENAQMTMFNLNNYLDVLKDGVFVSKASKYSHEGIVSFSDFYGSYLNRIIARIVWSYAAGEFTFKFYVESEEHFQSTTAPKLPEDVQIELGFHNNGNLNEFERLKAEKMAFEEYIAERENAIENDVKNIEDAKKRLAEIESDMLKLSEDNI